MPSRRQLDQRAETAEQKAQHRENQAAAIDEQAYYRYYDGGEGGVGEGYRLAHLVKETKQFVFLKRWDREWEKTHRCRKADFEAKGFAWCGRGTGVFRYYRGDSVKAELLTEAATYWEEAAQLRTQTPTHPEPTSRCTLWLTMFYETRRNHPQAVRRNLLNECLRYATTPQDYADLIDIAETYEDPMMVQMLRGEITVDDYWESIEITDRELNDCGAVVAVNWIREGF